VATEAQAAHEMESTVVEEAAVSLGPSSEAVEGAAVEGAAVEGAVVPLGPDPGHSGGGLFVLRVPPL